MKNNSEQPIRIMVPLDGSTFAEQALAYARAVSIGTAEIVLLRVLPPAKPVRGLLGDIEVSAEGVLSRALSDVTEELETIAQRVRSKLPGVDVTVRVTVGDAADQIIREAQEQGANLIVMASHGRGATGRLAFGSVADRVVRTSDTPVMIVRPQDAASEPGLASIRRLLVPLDGSELATQALSFAESMGKWLDVPIHVVTALDISQLTAFSLATGGMFSDEFNDELLGEFRQDIEQKLEKQATSLREGGNSVDWEIVEGHAIPVIENAARDGDIVIMTSHGRGGIGRWVIGSVAEKLVRHCPVPVILVRAKPLSESSESVGNCDSSASVAAN